LLEQGDGERDGKNQALINEKAELKRQLEDFEAKYAKSKVAKKKMDKLRSQWAGIASTFGVDIKLEEDDDAGSSDANRELP
jgi:hypothetical protein